MFNFLQQIENLDGEKWMLVEDLSASKIEISNLNGLVKRNSKENEDMITILTVNLFKKNEDMDRLVVQVREMKHTMSKNEQQHENDIKQYRDEIKLLQEEKDKFIEKSSALTIENSDQKKYINNLKQESMEKDNFIKHEIEKDKSYFKEQIENLMERKSKLSEDLSASKMKISDLNGFVERKSKEKEDMINTLATNLSKTIKENTHLVVQVGQMKHTMSENDQENENNIKQYREKIKQLEESLTSIKKISDQGEYINKLEAESMERENSIDELSKEVSKSNEKSDRILLDIDVLKQAISKKQQETEVDKSYFRKEIDTLKDEKCKLVENLSASEKKISHLNVYVERIRKEKDDTINSLITNFSKKNIENEHFVVQLDELKHTISENEQRNNNSIDCLKKGMISVQHEKYKVQNLSKTNEEKDRLVVQVGQLKQTILKNEKEVENNINQYRVEIKLLNGEKTNFIEESSALKTKNSNQREYINKLEMESTKKEKSIRDLSKEVSVSNEKSDRFHSNIDELKKIVSKKEQEIEKDKKYFVEQIENLKDEKSKLLGNLSALQKKTSDRNVHMERNRKEKDDTIKSWITKFSKKNEENDHFEAQVDELKHTISENELKNKNNINRFKEGIKNLQNEKRKLQMTNEVNLVSLRNNIRKQKFCWRKTSDSVLTSKGKKRKSDLIDCPAMTVGVYKWSISIEKSGKFMDGIDLTVISSEYRSKDSSFAGHAGCWEIDSGGDAWCNGLDIGAGYSKFNKEGAIVSFTLDLTLEGTLSYFVDDGPAHNIFTNMKKELGNFTEGRIGFIPAACVQNGSEIRFLGFENG